LLWIRNLASTSELGGLGTKHYLWQHMPKVLNQPKARAHPLFIAHKPNRAVAPSLGTLREHRTKSPGHRTIVRCTLAVRVLLL
jgi:hypothetical protein